MLHSCYQRSLLRNYSHIISSRPILPLPFSELNKQLLRIYSVPESVLVLRAQTIYIPGTEYSGKHRLVHIEISK